MNTCADCLHYRNGLHRKLVTIPVWRKRTYGKGEKKVTIEFTENRPITGNFCLYYKVELADLARANKCKKYSPGDEQMVLDDSYM